MAVFKVFQGGLNGNAETQTTTCSNPPSEKHFHFHFHGPWVAQEDTEDVKPSRSLIQKDLSHA